MVPAGDPPEQLGAAGRDQLGPIAGPIAGQISCPSASERFGVAEQKEVGARWEGGRTGGRSRHTSLVNVLPLPIC
jgi:hypothetical protein